MHAFIFQSDLKKCAATLNEIVGHYFKCGAVFRRVEPGKTPQPMNGVVRQGANVRESESDDSDSDSDDGPPPPKTPQRPNLPPKKQPNQQMKSPPKPPGKETFTERTETFVL